MEDKEKIKDELKSICEKIVSFPQKNKYSKEEKSDLAKLWNKKRELLAKLNPINDDKMYV